MKCSICGREVDDALEFCDLCGASMAEAEEISAEENEVENVPYMMAPVTSGQYSQGYMPQYQEGGFYPPYTPPKKKKKKWPKVLLCIVLAIAIAFGSLVAIVMSQPEYVIAMAFNKTFVESDNLSFKVIMEFEGGNITVDGSFVKGDTPEENLIYCMIDGYVEAVDTNIQLEYGYCDGKLYTSYGQFDMNDVEYWTEIEELLKDELDIEVDIDDIYARLTDPDITEDELADIFDEEIFPLIEDIVYKIKGEEIEFPPFADIRESFLAFFEGFVDKYIELEEIERKREYSFEMNIDDVLKDFFEYMEEDETLSQLLDIMEVIFGDDTEEDDSDDVVADDEAEEVEDTIISGAICIDDDGYIETIEIDMDGIFYTIEIWDVNETELDESDIQDIDVIFDVNEFAEFYF